MAATDDMATAQARIQALEAELAQARAELGASSGATPAGSRIHELESTVAALRAELALQQKRLGDEVARRPVTVVLTPIGEEIPCCARQLGRPRSVFGTHPVPDLALDHPDGAWLFREGIEDHGTHAWRELSLRAGSRLQLMCRLGDQRYRLRTAPTHDPRSGGSDRVVVAAHDGNALALILLAVTSDEPRVLATRVMEEPGAAFGHVTVVRDDLLVRCHGKLELLSLRDLATVGELPGPPGWPAVDAHWDLTGQLLLAAFQPQAGAPSAASRLILYGGSSSWDIGAAVASRHEILANRPDDLDTTIVLPALRMSMRLIAA